MAEDYEPASVLDQDGQLTSYNLCTFAYDGESGGHDYISGCTTGIGELDLAHMKDFPWLITGAKELNLPFVDSDSGTNDVFYLP